MVRVLPAVALLATLVAVAIVSRPDQAVPRGSSAVQGLATVTLAPGEVSDEEVRKLLRELIRDLAGGPVVGRFTLAPPGAVPRRPDVLASGHSEIQVIR